jgi:hypothetical protein
MSCDAENNGEKSLLVFFFRSGFLATHDKPSEWNLKKTPEYKYKNTISQLNTFISFVARISTAQRLRMVSTMTNFLAQVRDK